MAAETHVEQATAKSELVVALAGNPNVGKTTLFNAITGLKQKVANYPGVTVEKKMGRAELKGPGGERVFCQIVDLPGTYSLASRSPDEHVARQVVLGQMAGTPRPDVIIVVCDASNIERNLFLVTQVLELGRPTVVALSMVDIARENGRVVDAAKLSAQLGVPVIEVQAHRKLGIDELKSAVALAAGKHSKPLELPLPELMETHVHRLAAILREQRLAPDDQADFDAHLMLSMGDDDDAPDARRNQPKIRAALTEASAALDAADIDPIAAEIEAHYSYIGGVVSAVVSQDAQDATGLKTTRTDRLDRILTHKFWGMLIFVGVMATVFVTIFWLADPIMKAINDTGGLFDHLQNWVSATFGEGPLVSLINEGIIAGVGNVVVFLPQIAMLFLFLAVLEDSGYMSRAAFLMDRLMSKVGLHGKSFIPLLSGYACAVPAIMGTRVIENRRDRLATILILPLMSCSARLPIYSLIIASFFGPRNASAGEQFRAALHKGGILLIMYLLGTFSAFGMAWLFKRTLLKGPPPTFILEMPPYRMPQAKTIAATVWQRCWAFLKRAGTLIFAFSVMMWAGTHYPQPAHYSQDFDGKLGVLQTERVGLEKISAESMKDHDKWTAQDSLKAEAAVKRLPQLRGEIDDLQNAKQSEILEHSAAGRVGHFITPVFAPLGFDWKLSIGVTGAFFAREVVVSTMGIIYSVGQADEGSTALQTAMRNNYSPLIGITLLMFVVYCMQCLSTLAIARRETGTWKWPAFMFVYMTAMAWLAAFLVFYIGTLLGLGT